MEQNTVHSPLRYGSLALGALIGGIWVAKRGRSAVLPSAMVASALSMRVADPAVQSRVRVAARALDLTSGAIAGGAAVTLFHSLGYFRSIWTERSLMPLVMGGREMAHALGFGTGFSLEAYRFATGLETGEERPCLLQRRVSGLIDALVDFRALQRGEYRAGVVDSFVAFVGAARGAEPWLFDPALNAHMEPARLMGALVRWLQDRDLRVDEESGQVVWGSAEARGRFVDLVVAAPIPLPAVVASGERGELAVRSLFEMAQAEVAAFREPGYVDGHCAAVEALYNNQEASREECQAMVLRHNELADRAQRVRRLVDLLGGMEVASWTTPALREEFIAARSLREPFQQLRLANRLSETHVTDQGGQEQEMGAADMILDLRRRGREELDEDEEELADREMEILGALALTGAQFQAVFQQLNIEQEQFAQLCIDRGVGSQEALVAAGIIGTEGDNSPEAVMGRLVERLQLPQTELWRRRFAALFQGENGEEDPANNLSTIGRVSSWGYCAATVTLAVLPLFVEPIFYGLGFIAGFFIPLNPEEPRQLLEEESVWRDWLASEPMAIMAEPGLGLDGALNRLALIIRDGPAYQRLGCRGMVQRSRHFGRLGWMGGARAAYTEFELSRLLCSSPFGSAVAGGSVGGTARRVLGITATFHDMLPAQE